MKRQALSKLHRKRKPAFFTPYFTQEDAGWVRAAFRAAGAAEGCASVSDLIEKAVLKEVRRVQPKYNGGMPWEPVLPGSTYR